MNIGFKKIILLALVFLSNSGSIALADNPPKDTIVDTIVNTIFYKNVAISEVESRRRQELIASKVAIHTIALKPNLERDPLSRPTMVPTLGKLLWTITPQQLSVAEHQCHKETIDLCSDEEYCYKPCLTYGPIPLTFDEKTNKLYLAVSTTAQGATGIGPHFTFVADINKKEIKPLTPETVTTPYDSSLSPSGNYLALIGTNTVTVINTKTGEIAKLGSRNNWRAGEEELHYMGDIKWLSDTQFSYQDGTRHNKFQESFDDMKEGIYDIPRKKILKIRTLAKTEYDSRPYKEP